MSANLPTARDLASQEYKWGFITAIEEERVTKGLSAATVAANDQVTFAVKYALMIISEATTKLGDTAPGLQSGLPWRAFGC